MSAFRRLNDIELSRLGDEAILAYLVNARAARYDAAARLALAVLVFAHMDRIEARVRLKVPAHAVEEVAATAMTSAIAGRLDGSSQGEFRAWLNTITNRRIADWLERRRLDVVPLAEEHGDDETVRGATPVEGDPARAVEVSLVIEQVLAEFNPVHRAAIEHYVFARRPAVECARLLRADGAEMTENNVHQIATRFRRRLRDELDAGMPGGPG